LTLPATGFTAGLAVGTSALQARWDQDFRGKPP
jgi:hypothetical protein